jgi:hypothetical protein
MPIRSEYERRTIDDTTYARERTASCHSYPRSEFVFSIPGTVCFLFGLQGSRQSDYPARHRRAEFPTLVDTGLLCTGITLIGLILWPVIAIYAIVQIVLAAIAAGESREYKFGFSYSFLK